MIHLINAPVNMENTMNPYFFLSLSFLGFCVPNLPALASDHPSTSPSIAIPGVLLRTFMDQENIRSST